MSANADIAEHRARLSRLAELSMAMVEETHAASIGVTDTADLCRLTEAFCKAGRCLRMAIALDMRLARDGAFAARTTARDDADLEDDLDDLDEREDWHEHPEREDLYDRLPSGDPKTQIAALVHDLTGAVRALTRPKARPIILTRDYEALCRDLIANDPPPTPPWGHTARGPPC